nr:hypothetical protein [Tanacetum cinerariifolium]
MLLNKHDKATKPNATKQSMPSVPKAAPVTKPATAKASKSTSSQQPKPATKACLTIKFNNFPKVQVKDLVLFQSSEYKSDAKVTEKQAGNVQTSLTLSSAKVEIQSMVDVPIHQEDPTVQRTLFFDTIISMVTDKTASTPTPPTTQAHVQICSTSWWKYISRGV